MFTIWPFKRNWFSNSCELSDNEWEALTISGPWELPREEQLFFYYIVVMDVRMTWIMRILVMVIIVTDDDGVTVMIMMAIINLFFGY